MHFCVDDISNHMSHCNLCDHSIAFARWRHIPNVWRAATTSGKSAQTVYFFRASYASSCSVCLSVRHKCDKL